MKTLLLAGACALACLSLGACQLPNTGNPADVITALGNAGCSGTVSGSIHAGTASGVSAGSASVDNAFNMTCDPTKAKPAATTPTPSSPPTAPQ